MILLTPKAPPVPPEIDLRCCSADEMLEDLRASGVRANLWHEDPPWAAYTQKPGQADPTETYECLSYKEIGAHIRATVALSAPGARNVMWLTHPLSAEIAGSLDLGAWRYKTGGGWTKSDHHGPGFHWAGCSELVHVYSLPGKQWRNTAIPLRNGYTSKPERHSEKPVEWLTMMVQRWVPPGGLVCELYAGLGSMARAVARSGEGRRYIGCEIDEERHAGALSLLAQDRR